jgi:hypothetical protein
MATSLQLDPSPASRRAVGRTVDVLWPRASGTRRPVDRTRQKEILLDVLADAASHSSIPVLAMDDDAAELDLTDDEQELRSALQALGGAADRVGRGSALWAPVEALLARFGRR